MAESLSVQDLHDLSDLLSPPDAEGSNAGDGDVDYTAELGPGHIGAFSPASRQDKNAAHVKNANEKNSKHIWELEEVCEGTHFEDLTDTRPQPKYEIILKQCVGTEDLFLGMSRTNPSSMCCESMLVKVTLPETQASDLVLDVKERFVDLRTPKYKLGLHLPHRVHHREGTAQFITERCELEITLPMNRCLDSINFP